MNGFGRRVVMQSVTMLRHRLVLFVCFLVFVLYNMFAMFSPPDMNHENVVEDQMTKIQLSLQHLEVMYREREQDVLVLGQQLAQRMLPADNLTYPALPLSAEARHLLRNMTEGNESVKLLQLPSAYQFLPHLLLNPSSLQPALTISRGRTGVSVVLGIPTVKRDKQSYLLATLQNILESMTQEEKDDVVLIVFIAETDKEFVKEVAKEVKETFLEEVELGIIEIIAPSAAFYPDWASLRETLGDSRDRVKWRSKQNLDFAFLMMYARPKGMFYVQLEDDIVVKPQFITTMKTVAMERTANKEQWFLIDFCTLGFIGKMFRCSDLHWLIQFFVMFYNDKPVDWLLYHILHTKACSLDKDDDQCKKDMEKLWIHYKPSLFQHIGTYSSLKGKVQNLKDKEFGKVNLHTPHSNPDAEVSTQIKVYEQYTLKRAYEGDTFFWGLNPQPGDQLLFVFKAPLFIKKYIFRSGNSEHPDDRLYNTTVEVLPVKPLSNHEGYNSTSDGFVIVGELNSLGFAEGTVSKVLGAIQQVRLRIHTESENWVILREVLIFPDSLR